MKKFGFALLIFLLAFAVPVAVYTVVTRGDDLDNRNQAADSAEVDSNHFEPEFTSVPITEADVGAVYSYKVHVTDDDGDELELRVRQIPDWLTWDVDQGIIAGTPEEGDVGTHRVEISVSDGKQVRTQTFDVVVAAGTSSQAPEGGGTLEESLVESINGGSEPSESDSGPVTSNGTASELGSAVSSSDADESGLLPVEQPEVIVAQQAEVLGTGTSLPKTAVSKWFLVAAIGCGVVAAGAFLWADGRWNIVSNVSSSIQYRQGNQIEMDMGDGVTVKKRKIEL